MIGSRRSLQERYKQLRIKLRFYEQRREQASKAEDMTTYSDCCRSIKKINDEIQEVLQAL